MYNRNFSNCLSFLDETFAMSCVLADEIGVVCAV